jgi:orotate phosphoribosyltransferase
MRKKIGEQLTVRSRVMAIVLGSVYLLFVAGMFEGLSGITYPTAVAAVFVGAAVIMASLAALAVRYSRSRGERRLSLSTVLLLFVPVAVYLTAFRWIYRELATPPSPVGAAWWFIGALLLALAVMTTVVLLWYAEAIVWFALRFVRWRRGEIVDPWLVGGPDAAAVLEALPMRRGHFVYESGHHGELWLDLELLCERPETVRPLVNKLAKRLVRHRPEVVCGPLVEGAFLALMVAEELEVEFCYAERIEHPERGGLFPVEYRLPKALRERVRSRRVAIVNDVINAGSAVRGTAADLKDCGAELVALATLAAIGTAGDELALKYGMPFYPLARIEGRVWVPEECPVCGHGARSTTDLIGTG